jgi:polysaccharide export outer membrane protein
MLAGCSKQNYLFQSIHEDYYKQASKHQLPVIKLREDTALTNRVHRIVPNQVLRVRYYNLPAELTPLLQLNQHTDNLYTVNADGMLVLPLVNDVYVAGLTLQELEQLLLERLVTIYLEPSVAVQYVDLAAFLYGRVKKPGVTPLRATRVHLVEVLGQAGELAPGAKARKIKIIRGNLDDPQVIWVDLNQLSAISDPDLMIQPGDIIYVEPRKLVVMFEDSRSITALINVVTVPLTVLVLLRRAGVR